MASDRTLPAVPQQRSTRLAFFVAGFAMAAWAPLVPYAKSRAGLDDATLGLLLLCLGAGSIATMPLAGAAAARFGCRAVILLASALICAALPLLATASSLAVLVPALLLFGAGAGSIDVSMNIQAIIVEKASGRAMMSGFHGLFSVGGIAGAAGPASLLAAGASPLGATLPVILGIALALGLAAPHLLAYGSRGDGPAFAWPTGIVLVIGALCFVLFLAEGAVLDWSAVFLTAVRAMPASYAGLGYAAFALAMTIGRLGGDRFVQRLGGARIILYGGLCAAAGFAITILVGSWVVTLCGYGLVGLGCSNIVPVLFSSVGRQTAMAENVAVPAITTLGYAGILAGPAAIGLVAHALSLPAAFLVLTVMLLGVAASGRLVTSSA